MPIIEVVATIETFTSAICSIILILGAIAGGFRWVKKKWWRIDGG